MRTSIRAGRDRMLAAGVSVLLAGAALAAATAPAQALTPVNQISLGTIGDQTTDPLSTPVDLSVSATEADESATLTFTVTGLPPGLSYSQTATTDGATLDITGTITAAGLYPAVTVTATDDLPAADTATETFTWTAKNTITVAAPAAETARVGVVATPVTVTAADNDLTALPLTFTATGLPRNLRLNATTGEITGTPTGPAGLYDVTVKATDATGATGTAVIAWTISNKITVTVRAPRKIYLRVKVSVRPSATDSGQNQQLTWSVSPRHPLPPGLSINPATGLISGRPQRLAAPPSTIIATDGAGSTGSAVITWVVSADGYLDNPGPETVTAGQGKDIVLSAVDYVPGDKVTWTATGLPAGMGFSGRTRMIYGWAAAAGTYHVTLTGHGSRGTYDAMTFKLVVQPATGKGATGQLRLALDGKCLRDPGGKTANGTAVTIANCGPGRAERWTVASDGTIRVSGRCLGIAGTDGTRGQRLRLWSCDGSPRERWAQGSDGQLIGAAFGTCVTDPGSSRRNGTVPVMSGCHVTPSEQWTLPAQPLLTSVGGSCADDHDSRGANGSVVDMFWCDGTRGQDWTFDQDGTIRAGLYSGTCVTARGARIVLWACSSGSKGQQWTVSRGGGLSSELRTGGVCLGITSLTAENATQLITARCAASDPRVHWRIG